MARHRRAHRRRMRHRARPLRPLAQFRHRRPLERQRVEPTNLQQRRVATQLPRQGLDRGVLEYDACDQRTPHRPHRVVVAPAAPPGLERSHDLFVGQDVERQPQPLKVRQAFDIPPRKGEPRCCRHHVLPTVWGWVEQGFRTRWRHLISDSGETTRRRSEADLGAGPPLRRAWGGNRLTAHSAEPRPAEFCDSAGVRKILGSTVVLAHQGTHDSAHASSTAHDPDRIVRMRPDAVASATQRWRGRGERARVNRNLHRYINRLL